MSDRAERKGYRVKRMERGKSRSSSMKAAQETLRSYCGTSKLVIHSIFPRVSCSQGRAWIRGWLSIPDLVYFLRGHEGRLILVCAEEQSKMESAAKLWGWKQDGDDDFIKLIGDHQHRYLNALESGTSIVLSRFGDVKWSEREATTYTPCTFAVWRGEVIYMWQQEGRNRGPHSPLERVDQTEIWDEVQCTVKVAEERERQNAKPPKMADRTSSEGRPHKTPKSVAFSRNMTAPNPAVKKMALSMDEFDSAFDELDEEDHKEIDDLAARTASWRTMSSKGSKKSDSSFGVGDYCDEEDSFRSMEPRSMSRPLHAVTDLCAVEESAEYDDGFW